MSEPHLFPIKYSASLLSADFRRLGEAVREIESVGIDMLHLDIMDGRFVPNISFGPLVLEALREQTSLVFDTHLMIVEPERHIPQFIEAGSQIISVHVETCPHLHRTVQTIRSLGARPSVVINPATPVVAIEPILCEIDQVLVMSVNPGFAAQQFIPSVLEKVRQLRLMREARGLSFDIEIDGGINPETAAPAVEAGVNVLVSGSSLLRKDVPLEKTFAALRAAVEAAQRK